MLNLAYGVCAYIGGNVAYIGGNVAYIGGNVAYIGGKAKNKSFGSKELRSDFPLHILSILQILHALALRLGLRAGLKRLFTLKAKAFELQNQDAPKRALCPVIIHSGHWNIGG